MRQKSHAVRLKAFDFPLVVRYAKTMVYVDTSPDPVAERTDMRGIAYHENVLSGRCRAPVVR